MIKKMLNPDSFFGTMLLSILLVACVLGVVFGGEAMSVFQAAHPGIQFAAFGTATVITSVGKGIIAKRMLGSTPSQVEPNFIGIGVGATGAARTAAVGDTALTTAVESRASGTSSTVTTTNTNDTYQSVATVTATAARAVDEAGMFDASSTGNMFFSATFAVINLSIGDSLQLTCKTQIT